MGFLPSTTTSMELVYTSRFTPRRRHASSTFALPSTFTSSYSPSGCARSTRPPRSGRPRPCPRRRPARRRGCGCPRCAHPPRPPAGSGSGCEVEDAHGHALGEELAHDLEAEHARAADHEAGSEIPHLNLPPARRRRVHMEYSRVSLRLRASTVFGIACQGRRESAFTDRSKSRSLTIDSMHVESFSCQSN